ncbi:MAG TPA: FtsX-like permease family protein [Thermoanaerobaculia bacterium]|nr:FtsX-like permease family protein [Thermoanaerobaculia bacterium]
MADLFGLRPVFRALVLGPARRHPLRLALPALGVAVGVAAVSAIQRANTSVTDSFREAAASLSGRSDFVITGVNGVPIDALSRLAFLWREGAFAPAVTGWAVLDDGSGELVEVLGLDLAGDSAVRDVSLVSDPAASRAVSLKGNAVFLTAGFARRRGLSVGRDLWLLAGGRRHRLAVAGLLAPTGVARAAAGDLLITDLFTAQRVLGKVGLVDRVDVVIDRAVSREAVRREILERLPAGLSIEPPGRSAVTADRMVRAFRFNLNALASLTLLVGVFLIANAVSISVLRRRPEIATLRSVGTSRVLIFAVFLLEGLLIGAAGTALGEFGGVLLSRMALRAVSGTVTSVYLPAAKITDAGPGGAALLAALVGMLSALAAAALPAAEATRVEPAPAIRPGSVEGVRRRRLGARGLAAGALLALAAVASLAPPVDGFPLFGFIAVVLVVAALALVAPLCVRAADRVLADLLARRFGAPGRIGSRLFGGSLARNGISVTALAMALGMTLAMIITVSSIRETVRVWVETTLASDLWVKSPAGRSSGIIGDLPEEIVDFLQGIPGVEAVDPFRARDQVDPLGRPYTLASGDFRVVARIGGLPLLDGLDARAAAQDARRRGEAMISEPYARRFGVRRGDTLAIPTPRGERRLRVAGVYRDYSNDRGTIVIDRELYLSLFGDRRVTSVAVLAAAGVDAADLRRLIFEAAKGRYALSISTNRELRREALRIFDRTFAVTHALEAIAVAVAVLGIANALVASAIERRRSFGLLRSFGASSRQIRVSVLVEAALTGLTASLLALPAGAAFAGLLLLVINPQSFGWTVVSHVPPGRLALTVALVLAASLLAGLYPGRLAAGVDPAAALAEE